MHRLMQKIYLWLQARLIGTGISLIPPFSWIKTLMLKYLRGKERVYVLGSMMKRDPLDRLNLAVKGVYEPEDTEFVRRIIKPGDVVYDIGANIGYYTLFFSRLAGPQGHVYAFEPAPDLHAILQENVRLNGYTNVTIEQKAVTGSTGPLTLFMEEGRPEDNRIFPDHKVERSEVSIQGVALDDMNLPAPAFIKMDIQGAEILALRGMRRILEQSKDVCLLTEFWPYGLQEVGYRPEELVDELVQAGLEVRRVSPELTLESIDRETIVDECGIGIGTYINLVAAHPERMQAVIEHLKTSS